MSNYISCAADCIVANPTTLTGSIGIFGMVPNMEKLLGDKLGLHFDVVKTNKLSDLGDTSRPFNATESAAMQNHINNGYKLFVQRCADGRGMTMEAIEEIAEGRVWTGSAAKELGLVDELGGIDKALEIAAQKAGVDTYSAISYPAKEGMFSSLINNGKSSYFEGKMKETMGVYYEPLKFIKNIQEMDHIQARLPFAISYK